MSFIRERKPGESQFSQYENLGFAVSCMLMNNNYSLYHIKTLQLWTQEAINQNQFKILFDHLNTPLGYITWAYLKDDTLSRFINDPQCLLHSSEWNEGGMLCILDFCCQPGSARLCMDYLASAPPIRDNDKVAWLSKKSGKLMVAKNKNKNPTS
ncbi:toxin-activating lysine-acyltransferase [Serratia marcescens]|uniref:RTX toxin-activating lysine-acyltransferase n=4 Tax=Serratia TaxID=613 RepID=A0ABX5NJG8_SERMA|nr:MULTISPECIES: toxin-activating lysine-acyltransferase [Serratia]MBX9282382.1 toxin-activating lysine-acyltransferase [Serratia marcescens]MBX9286195.1 toxin-activating lysine-acyltransferase [Serratia marcescens]MBX9304110.1 toxin-activating lysine-acyltransferase [Serratia marcescens]MBX9307380.1 toxin-activating lysine-acyltransferase [Serratia marcescens]MBX9310941.1 toxin-activating lysine-acyltransferase [Serratia marcescens]